MKTEGPTERQPQVATSAVVWPEWTTNSPQKSGYYWWKRADQCVPFIVHVMPLADGLREAVFPWGVELVTARQNVQWAGPIPPPSCHTDKDQATRGA